MNDHPDSLLGLSRADVDKAENKDFAIGAGPLRPRDAATLILIDRSGGQLRVLLGKRHRKHAFMPGKFVFPGGRTDAADARIRVVEGLHPAEEARLTGPSVRHTPARARAIALSALRETYEEAGLLIGRKGDFSTSRPDWTGFAEASVCPSLEKLRVIARAVTPPGRVRRFDTRFLSVWRDDVAVSLPDGGPTKELEELVWLPIADAKQADIPAITKTVLGDLERRIAEDPDLTPGGGEAPFYRMRGNRFHRLAL